MVLFNQTDRQTGTHLMATFQGKPRQAGTRKVKPIWILIKQETIGWQWHQLDSYVNHLLLAPYRQPCQHLIT